MHFRAPFLPLTYTSVSFYELPFRFVCARLVRIRFVSLPVRVVNFHSLRVRFVCRGFGIIRFVLYLFVS